MDNGVTRPLSQDAVLRQRRKLLVRRTAGKSTQALLEGLRLDVAYTYSKTLIEGYGRNEGDGVNNQNYQDKNDRASEKGRVGFDARQVVVSSFIYDMPAPESCPPDSREPFSLAGRRTES